MHRTPIIPYSSPTYLQRQTSTISAFNFPHICLSYIRSPFFTTITNLESFDQDLKKTHIECGEYGEQLLLIFPTHDWHFAILQFLFQEFVDGECDRLTGCDAHYPGGDAFVECMETLSSVSPLAFSSSMFPIQRFRRLWQGEEIRT
jgi:hypothetical protein